MSVYHNDSDPYVAQWLRNLIDAGHLPAGEVDERPIQEVQPEDVGGFTQAHFFAGIGGWPLACKLARWPVDRPIWTGSCPCQPFSSAGKQQGIADKRHLWPEFFRLIAQRRPPSVAGEQVASKLGREWLAAVRADLEGVGYAVGGADLCAAGVGAPHIRQRLWWVADSDATGRRREQDARIQRPAIHDVDRRRAGDLGHSNDARLEERDGERRDDGAECATAERASGGLGDATLDGVGTFGRQSRARSRAQEPLGGSGISFWSRAEWLACRDGKVRPVEPSIFPLAYGVPGRVGKLRAAGNAIVPQVAAEILKAWMETAP
jgi:DNA (cytosine-5)-methyltransferase 1